MDMSEKTPMLNCVSTCSGDVKEDCGGYDFLSLYKLSKKPISSKTTTKKHTKTTTKKHRHTKTAKPHTKHHPVTTTV